MNGITQNRLTREMICFFFLNSIQPHHHYLVRRTKNTQRCDKCVVFLMVKCMLLDQQYVKDASKIYRSAEQKHYLQLWQYIDSVISIGIVSTYICVQSIYLPKIHLITVRITGDVLINIYQIKRRVCREDTTSRHRKSL